MVRLVEQAFAYEDLPELSPSEMQQIDELAHDAMDEGT